MTEFNFEEFKERNSEIFEGRTPEEIEEVRKVVEPFGAFMGAFFEMNNKRKLEAKRVGTITNITAEMGEECKVNVDKLHETIEKLPADIYIELFHKMQVKIYGNPAFSLWGNNGGCGCSPVEDKTE